MSLLNGALGGFVGKRSSSRPQLSREASPESKVRLNFLLQHHFALAALVSFLLASVWTTSLGWTEIRHDLSSYLAPGVLLIESGLEPYGTFFDIKPPFLIYFFVPWVFIFGSSIESMSILHLFVMWAHLVLIYVLGHKLTESAKLGALLFFSFVMWVSATTAYFGMMLTSELIGNVLSLLAILAVISAKEARRPGAVFFAAGLAAGFATLTKEVYVAVAITVVLFAWITSRSRLRNAVPVVLGGLGSIAVVALILLVTGDFQNYLRVMQLKGELFPFPGLDDAVIVAASLSSQLNANVFWSASLLIGLAALSSAYFLVKRRVSLLPQATLALVSAIGFLIAVVWQSKPMVGHYAVTMFIPLFIGLAWFARLAPQLFAESRRRSSAPFWPAVAVAFLVLPNISIGFSSFGAALNSASPAALAERAEEIANNKANSDGLADLAKNLTCVQEVYGWAAGRTYIATQKPPCSEYFLVNIILGSPEALGEYQQEMIESPPQLVLYSPNGADLPVDQFESIVFPWQQVLAQCYEPTNIERVFVGVGEGPNLAGCVSEVIG